MLFFSFIQLIANLSVFIVIGFFRNFIIQIHISQFLSLLFKRWNLFLNTLQFFCTVDEGIIENAFLEMFKLLAENFDDVLESVLSSVEETLSKDDSFAMWTVCNSLIRCRPAFPYRFFMLYILVMGTPGEISSTKATLTHTAKSLFSCKLDSLRIWYIFISTIYAF